jgi:hypothetical protein
MIFEILTAVKINIMIRTPCSLVDGYQHFYPEDGDNIFLLNVGGLTTYHNTRCHAFEEHNIILWFISVAKDDIIVETPQVLTEVRS